jgi:hypothetical protein
MKEIFPGVHHWTAVRDTIGMRVSSYWVQPAGIVIDPLVPDEGLGAFTGLRQVVLTTGLHSRHAERFADEFGIPVRAPREAAERIGDRLRFDPYADGEQLEPGVQAVHIGELCPDEYALHITVSEGAVALADAVEHYGDALAFFSDGLLGDDPEAVKAGLRARLRELAARDFEHLLFAHGDPIVGGGRAALRAFTGT